MRNHADRTVHLQGWGPQPIRMTICPGTSMALGIHAGRYRYHAEAKNVLPCSGTVDFQRRNRYTWTFFIR